MPDQLLPWERPNGDPVGTGICLSGGGLRAASFSMGVMQALQEHRGLLYGSKSAELLAVVSGGSYVGATHLLNAPTSTPSCPPLDPLSPEAAHVEARGRYLIEDGLKSIWPLAWRLPVSLLASTLLLAWTGFMLADLSVLLDRFTPLPVLTGLASWIGVLTLFAAVALLGASQQTDRLSVQLFGAVVGLTGTVTLSPTLLRRLGDSDWLARPLWWTARWPALLAAGTLYGLASVTPYVLGDGGRRLSEAITRNGARAAMILVSCWAAAAMIPHMIVIVDEQNPSGWYFFAIAGPLAGGLWASYVHDVISWHRPYRDRLARCFAVRRNSHGSIDEVEPVTSAKVSERVPPQLAEHRHPRLLICATANLRGGASQAASFVFSHDRSGLVGLPDASFSTDQLELGSARASVTGRRREPELSLMGAVAMTGAAIAPTMGAITNVGARPLLALLNIRLGVWLPNPLSPIRREVVAMRPGRPPTTSRKRSEHGRLGPGFSVVLAEILGSHSRHARRIYVTDGGHFDNLGLLALLRARAATIWCVDAYSGRKHLDRQLDVVINLASSELGVAIDIDLNRFALVPTSDCAARFCFASGTIRYPGTDVLAHLIVVKSCLTPTTPVDFHEYRKRDRGFPYHSTAIQWYGAERFEHYRRLGHLNCCEALESIPWPASSHGAKDSPGEN